MDHMRVTGGRSIGGGGPMLMAPAHKREPPPLRHAPHAFQSSFF